MTAVIIGFVAGIVVGIAASIVAGIAILNLPVPERDRPIYSINGGRRTYTSGPETPYQTLTRILS
jgi:hypothetical protein